MPNLMPRQPVPAVSIATLDGSAWDLQQQSPEQLSMLVFYRGLHCPICKPYIRQLDRSVGDFAALGVNCIALSTDTEERARQTQEDWGLKEVRVGYGLAVDEARQWGLYISSSRGKTSIGIEEPALFNEPGIFLVQPDNTLYWASVQSMPFARPNFDDILKALSFTIEKGYPARGEA